MSIIVWIDTFLLLNVGIHIKFPIDRDISKFGMPSNKSRQVEGAMY